jgi:Ni,Fe-hydrogenase III small subunit/ferredoxin
MAWILRGLRDGIVTTRYPRRPDAFGPSYRGAVEVAAAERFAADGESRHAADSHESLAGLCPTRAITSVNEAGGEVVRLDRGRCILCGRCVARRPERFAFSPSLEVASVARAALVVPESSEDDEAVARLRDELGRRVKALRRSIHVRHVDAGSDGAEEWEIAALGNPVYDVQRLGIFFTATPRHADVLLVTGVGTAAMAGPLRTTYEAMADPKVVVAAGTDAISGGLVTPTYAAGTGVGAIVPVDVFVPGSPPSPFSLLHGLLLAVGLLPASRTAR